MFRKLAWGVVALGVLGAGTVGRAATVTTVTVLPGSGTNVVGSGNSAPGFPTGSWQSNAPGSKSEFYIAASSLFNAPVKIADIGSISYWTNIPGSGGDPNWTFYMYTADTRLNSEPYFTNSTVASNTWHQWSSGGSNPMRFYDWARDGHLFGTYSDPTLAQLQAGPVTWPTSGMQVDYRDKTVGVFSFQTGSAWGSGFTGLLDGLTITLKNGDVGVVNFEAVAAPLPSPAWGGLALLGAAGVVARYRSGKANA